MMINFFKRLKRKLNPYKTIPASEAFKGRPLVRSNVPGPYLMSGVTNRYMELNNSEYREKLSRMKNGKMNKMDILEKEIQDNIRTLIYDYYNYPHKIIPILNLESSPYRKKILELNSLINCFIEKEDKKIIELNKNDKYNKYTPSGLSLTKSHEKNIDNLIHILKFKFEELNEIVKYEIYEDAYSKLVSLNDFICNILIMKDYIVDERIDFYND